MTDFSSWRLWAAILLLLDAAFGLWFSDRLGSLWPPGRVRRIALIDAAAALGILVIHFLVDPH